MATSNEIEKFKDTYDVAGLTDEEIALIIGESENKRGRLDEQRLIGEAMRAKGRRGGRYDARTGITVSGGLGGLAADVFERYSGNRKAKEATAGLESMEAADQDRMRLRINRLRAQAQAAQAPQAQGPMGPPVAQAPAPAPGGMVSQAPLQAPQPSIPDPQLNIPQDQFTIDPSGATQRGRGTASVGGIPFNQPGWHPPMAPPQAPSQSPSMGGLTPEEQATMQKWLQGLRR